MKKLLTLTLLFLLPLLAKAYDAEVDGIYYNLDTEKKEAEVTYQKYDENNWRKYQSPYSGEVNIPEKIIFDGAEYTVIAIGEGAFYCCRDLNSIAIPNSVTTIKDNAIYGCTALTSIIIPNSVTYIGRDNFYEKQGGIGNNLTSIKVESGNTKYDSRNDCNAIIETASNTLIVGCENTTIPNTVSKIGDFAFCHCGISSVVIPNSVITIGDYAFYFCYNMTELTIGNAVKTIGKGAFHDCKISKLTISQSVESIGEEAFSYCETLSSLFIPSNVTYIGKGAFTGCTGLSSIVVDEGNIHYDSRDNCNAIIESSTNKLINGCKNTIIPNSVTTIGYGAITNIEEPFSVDIPNSVTLIDGGAFAHCRGLISVTIPNSVASIGNAAFAGCTGLTSLTIPNSVKTIGSEAFWSCYNITSLSISESLETIGRNAFGDLGNLKTLTIPSSLKSIGDYAFSNCFRLTEIRSMITEPFEINTNCWLYLKTEDIPLYVPYGTKAKYESTSGWNVFKNIVEMEPTGIAIDEVNFPDENFRNWILSQNFGADGLLTDEEIATVTGISVEEKEISDLKGIEYFTALIWLACEGNKLTNLDISKNTALMALRCDENKLTSLDVSKNLAMTELTCGGNQLATLDVSNNTALWNLVCYNNQLAALDVSKNIALTQLLCNSNQLTSLDVTKNTALKLLWCYNNQLTSLDVSANTELTELLCYSNHLSSLDVSANEKLEKLWCDNNQLSSLDVSSNSKLHELYCFANLIKGDGMESLVASLPETTNGDLYAISHFYENEQNEVTKDQVAAAKKKGWTIYHVDMEQNKWVIYEGSDPVLPKITINANGGQVYYNKEEIDNTIETFDIEEGLNRLFFPTDTILKITVNGEDVTSQLTLMDAVITSVDEFGRTRDKRIADVPSLLITPTGQNLQVDIEFVGDRQVIQEDGILYVIDGSEAYVAGATDCPENLVLPSSVTNEGKSYKIIGLIPKCFSYWKELKSVSLPESLKYVTVGAFFVCENLENVEISSNVEYIGEFAFYYNKIKTIKVFAKDPIKCFGFDNDVFNSVLYVPKGCKTKYENADFWKYFKTIVEMGIVPVDEWQTIDIGNEITENTDLDGNVVGNIYYSISSGDGSYNPTEGCLVLTKPTNDLAINLYDIFSEYFNEQFNGLAFKLAPGKGSIKVEAETQGNMVLKVKIGNNDPIEMELDGKLKVKFPYNVSEETLVYIYGGMSTAGAKATGGTRASADADLLKIYGFEVVSDASGIDAIENGLPANAEAPVYNLNGQRVDTPTKGIYIKNGRKVLVK